MTGSDLSDLVDTKLVSHVMTPEGTRFADARYGTYMSEYGELFANYPDYGVADDADNYAKAERMLFTKRGSRRDVQRRNPVRARSRPRPPQLNSRSSRRRATRMRTGPRWYDAPESAHRSKPHRPTSGTCLTLITGWRH